MKLLIVEDDSSLAEVTAELLRSVDQAGQRFEAITLAADLRTAIECLPGHDAILCDGAFPLAPDSTFVVDDWDVVREEAYRHGIHFVLYSGSARALDSARESNTPALPKPAAIEEIYAALTSGYLTTEEGSETASQPVEATTSMKKEEPAEKVMTESWDEYCRKLEAEVAALGRQVEEDARAGHLHAFNFGRTLGRLENSHGILELPARCLLLGVAVGAALATVCLFGLMSQHAIFSVAH